jgi:hypothetical protein
VISVGTNNCHELGVVASVARLLSQLERAGTQILTSSRDINRATLRCGPTYDYVYKKEESQPLDREFLN